VGCLASNIRGSTIKDEDSTSKPVIEPSHGQIPDKNEGQGSNIGWKNDNDSNLWSIVVFFVFNHRTSG
jgi:hypothetical protein